MPPIEFKIRDIRVGDLPDKHSVVIGGREEGIAAVVQIDRMLPQVGEKSCGGLGVVAAGNAPADYVRQQIQITKSLTEKPFGVNIMLMSPFADEVAQVAAEERVAVVTTGAGNPSKYMQLWKDAGIKVIPVVASVAMA